MAEPTALEQLMLELINRARANPAAEAARFGIDLNKDLAPGTIDTAPKQALAFNPLLIDSSDRHSNSMLNGNYFSHTGSDGSSATQRMFAAGWTSASGAWSTGENISFTASFDPGLRTSPATIESQHRDLFLSSGHRTNIMNGGFSEIGIDQATGPYTSNGVQYPHASMVTQNFADGGRQFITGVALADRDGDRFYDIGEGLGGITVTAVGGGRTYTAVTWGSGGYSLDVASGTYTVTFSGGALGGTIIRTVTVGTDNVKIDAFTADAIPAIDGWSYLASYADLIRAFGPRTDLAQAHWQGSGRAEGRTADAFDEWSYVASHADLTRAFGANVGAAPEHYVRNGFAEGRARDSFDEWSYLASHEDLSRAFGANGTSAVQHYVRHGFAEGRARDSFAEWSYVASHTDLIRAFGGNGGAGTEHYVRHGLAEGRARDSFDELRYIASHRDLINAFRTNGEAGAQHYVTHGFNEGRSATAFDPAKYLSKYADLQAAFGTNTAAATEHYILFGAAEGRTDVLVV